MRKYKGLIIVMSFLILGCGSEKENNEVGEVASSEEETHNRDEQIELSQEFPQTYEEIIGNTKFDLQINVDNRKQIDSLVEARAGLIATNRETAFQKLYEGITEYEVFEYPDNIDENGEKTTMISYADANSTGLGFGPYSSTVNFMKLDLTKYILSSFNLQKGELYNANQYSTTNQLGFMSREAAVEQVEQDLIEMGIDIEYIHNTYALDYQTLEREEEHIDIYGNKSQTDYKEQWSNEDECYYITMRQQYKGVPVLHVYADVFTKVEDANTAIQVMVSSKGYEFFNIEKVFEFAEEKEITDLANIEEIVKTVGEKYGQILGETTYEFTEAELYYFVDVHSGTNGYSVKPVWLIEGIENANGQNSELQIVIDAQSAEEIVL